MSYTITKEFSWSASHQLDGLPVDHPCSRLHGHNYTARVELHSERLDSTGFVLDYGALAPLGWWITAKLDHRHLNDVEELHRLNPTAEHLAEVLGAVLRDVVQLPGGVRVGVAVSETPKTWATWTEDEA